MPVPISVVLGLATEQESIADVGALVCSNFRIADGLSPILWNAAFENCAESCPVDCSCVPEKARESTSLKMKWKPWAPPQTMLCIVHGSRHGALAKKMVAHATEMRTKPPHPRQKATATNKPRHHLLISLQLREPIPSRLLPRRPRLGLRHGTTD